MKHSNLSAIAATLIKAKEPLMIVGRPGIGKTDMIKQLANGLKHQLLISHPVVDDPTDYKGMPGIITRPDGEQGAAFLPFGNLYKLIEAEQPTIAFLDDLGQSPPAVQAAIMQLVLGRSINGQDVSDNVVFIAATNRRQDQAAVQGLISPLLDRFITVLTLDFDLEDWVVWAIEAGVPQELISFARFRPDLMNKFEPSRDMDKQPTPRSVAGLGRLIQLGINDPEAFQGAVGAGYAVEFTAFQRVWHELPNVEEIFKNPTKVPVPEKIDVRYALMGRLAFSANMKNFDSIVKFLERCPAEFGVLCVKDAYARNKKLHTLPSFMEWSMKNADLFMNTRSN